MVLAAGPAAAEIATGGERVATRTPAANSLTGTLEGIVRARCWQQGQEILSEADFASAAIAPALREQAISLNGNGRTAVLLPFADTFCLLTVSP